MGLKKNKSEGGKIKMIGRGKKALCLFRFAC
jgi:hypothetical protein